MASSTPPTSAILLIDLPPKTFVGIDLVSFNSSPKFHGITNLPAGFHYLYTGTDAALSIRHCHWLNFTAEQSQPQCFVLRWLPEIESLDLIDPSSDIAKAALRRIPSLQGRGLVDYIALQDASSDLQAKQAGSDASKSAASAESWPTLIRHITSQTLNRILHASETNSAEWMLSSISSAPGDTETIPGLSSEEAAGVLHDNHASLINLTVINLKQTWPDGSIGRDRTEKARDRSWYLGHIIDTLSPSDADADSGTERQQGAKELLAELQFCFLMVLTLANYSCLEQWKRLLSVILTCKLALTDVEGFFVEVVKVLRAQLGRVDDVEGGLFEMGDENGSAWLRSLLKTFRLNVNEVFDDKVKRDGLRSELAKLEEWLREAYGWEDESTLLRKGMVDLEDGERVEVQMEGLDEDEETGEYAPVVVEM